LPYYQHALRASDDLIRAADAENLRREKEISAINIYRNESIFNIIIQEKHQSLQTQPTGIELRATGRRRPGAMSGSTLQVFRPHKVKPAAAKDNISPTSKKYIRIIISSLQEGHQVPGELAEDLWEGAVN